MSFDLSAILETIARKLGPATEKPAYLPTPNGLDAVALVRDGYQAAHSPGRKEPRPAHHFTDLGDFAAYLNRHAKGEARCDVLIDGAGAKAVFDHDSSTAPRLSCALRLHPDYAAWSAVFGKPLGIEALHDHVRAVMPTFTALDEKGTVTTGEHLLAQLGQLEVVRGGGLKIHAAAHGLIEYSAAEDKTTVSGRFPDRFGIVTPIYESVLDATDKLAAYSVEVLLTLKVSGDGQPIFVLRAPRKAVAELDALRGAVAYLRRLLDPSFLVGVGEARSVEVNVGPALE